MKIFNNSIEKVLQMYKKQEVKKEVQGTSRLGKKDEVKLSDQARDFQIAMKALKDVPDIRKDKVEAVKKEIQTGTYEINSGKIVEKIFESINIDKKI